MLYKTMSQTQDFLLKGLVVHHWASWVIMNGWQFLNIRALTNLRFLVILGSDNCSLGNLVVTTCNLCVLKLSQWQNSTNSSQADIHVKWLQIWENFIQQYLLFVCLFIIHSVNPYMVKTTGYRICHYKLHQLGYKITIFTYNGLKS